MAEEKATPSPGAPQEGGPESTPTLYREAAPAEGKGSDPATAAPTSSSTETSAAATAASPTEAPAKEPEKDKGEAPASSWAALSRKEKALVQREKTVKQLEGFKERASTDPLAAAQELWGENWYAELTNRVLDSQGNAPNTGTEGNAEVAELRKRLEAIETERKETQTKAQEAAQVARRASALNATLELAGKSPEKFRRVVKLGSECGDLIWATAAEMAAGLEEGQELSDTAVLEAVEHRLGEAYKRLHLEEAAAAAVAANAAPPKPTSQPTLTNSHVSESPRDPNPKYPTDPDELDRAILGKHRFYRAEA